MVAHTPNWANSLEELRSYIATAQMNSMNQPATSGTGSGIHIGVFDSRYKLGDNFTEKYHINQGLANSFVPDPQSNMNGHGIAVFDQLSAVAPNAEFSIYHAINNDGELTVGAYADAISKALEDDVDIINISAGDPWRGPIQINPLVQETARLLENNIPIVAAAGNYDAEGDQDRPPVHCPSATEGVISVGGYISRCPAEPGTESTDKEEGPYYHIPPDEDIDGACNGSYCGEQGCVNGESCITKQSEAPWEGNPLPTGDKPDVLAPMHILQENDDGDRFLGGGTSFATPLVTGSLACIFSELEDIGKELPSPIEAENAVRNGSSRLRDSQIGKYDAMGSRRVLNVT